MLQWALKYLNQGWSVIPLKPKSKEPLLYSWKNYQTTLPTKSEILTWFTGNPAANLAILAGSLSGLTVLDVDGEVGENSLLALNIESPITVSTGSGKHLYFRFSPIQNSVKKVPGLDIRGGGGYVVAPPSIHPSGAIYKWTNGFTAKDLPLFPLEKWNQAVVRNQPIQTRNDAWVTDAIKNLKPGNRNDTFTRLAGKLHDGHTSSHDIFSILRPHASASGLSDSEIQSIVTSVTRYDRETIDVYYPAANLDDYKQFHASHLADPKLQTGFRSLDQVTGGLRGGEILTVGARTGVGKTTFSLAITKNLLERGSRVTLCTTEMSRFSILDRLTAPDGEEKYTTLARYGRALAIVDKSSPRLVDVQKVVQEVRPDVLVFDHIQHTGGFADSDRENISRFIRGLKDLGRAFGLALLVCSQIRRLFRDKQGIESNPTLSDLKESGTIEEESGAVILLSNASNNYEGNTVTLLADLAKNRYGPLTRFSLEFNKTAGTFKELI